MEETMPATMVPTDRSEQLSELVKALCDARPNFGRIEKGLEGEMKGVAKRSGNAYSFKFKYADLAAAVEATSLALAESGLNIFQSFEDQSERSVVIVTELWHTSGQWMRTRLRMPCSFDPQSIGIASTYGRRYAYLAILGLAPEDVDGDKLGAARPPASAGPPSDWKPKPAAAVKSKPAVKPAAEAVEVDIEKDPKFKTWAQYWQWIKMGYGTTSSDGPTIGGVDAKKWLDQITERIGWTADSVERVFSVELGLTVAELPVLTGDGFLMRHRVVYALKKSDPNVIMSAYDDDEAERALSDEGRAEEGGSVDPPAETLDAMSGALMSFAGIKWVVDEVGEGEEKKLELAAWEALQAALVVTVGMDLPTRSEESLAKLTDKSRNGGRDLGAVKDLVIRRLGGVQGGMILHDIPEYIVPTLLKVLATFPAAKLAGDIVGDQVGLDDLSVNDGAGEANYAGSEG